MWEIIIKESGELVGKGNRITEGIIKVNLWTDEKEKKSGLKN